MPTPDPIVRVRLSPEGRALGAVATRRIDAPAATIWRALSDFERYARQLPMVTRVQKQGDRVVLHLGFRVGLFSAGFNVTADTTYEPERRLEVRWVSGEPRELRLVFTIRPIEGTDSCEVDADAGFDVQSLGWLVKYFLKHHPEIQQGIFPGVTLNLLEALRREIAAGQSTSTS